MFKNKKVKPFIEFNITEKCNYCCDYCSQGHLNKKYPNQLNNATDEVIEGLIKFIKELGQDYEVNLIGGEPFCHPRLIETAKAIADLGNKIMLITNMSASPLLYKQFIEATNNKLHLIHGALHIAQIKNLDKNIQNIIEVKKLINPNTIFRICSVVEEDTFETLKYIESKLKKEEIEFIFLRCLKSNGRYSYYSKQIEDYIRPKEHQYNRDIITNKQTDTSKVMCFAGYKILHINTKGDVLRCWSKQSKNNFEYFGNVKEINKIKLFKKAMPCFAKNCNCNHPTTQNGYYYSIFAPLYRLIYK